jgi:hypothetical protein
MERVFLMALRAFGCSPARGGSTTATTFLLREKEQELRAVDPD